MTDGTFERVQHSDARMYGPTKLLLCGFPAPAQPRFLAVLDLADLRDTPVVWVTDADRHQTLKTLLQRPDGSGAAGDSTLPRAVIVSGITENQLHALMTGCRQSGMPPALWAALTPTSEGWPMERLLDELQAERRALSRRSNA